MKKQEFSRVTGEVTVTLTGPDGEVKAHETFPNLITLAGDQYYAMRGALSTPPAPVNGMKLGTDNTAPTKTGTGAALVAYLADSHQALQGEPTASAGVATFTAVWGPGKATTASAINEVVLVAEDPLTDATSAANATIARALVTGIAAKGAEDTLTIVWQHTITGA